MLSRRRSTTLRRAKKLAAKAAAAVLNHATRPDPLWGRPVYSIQRLRGPRPSQAVPRP